MVMTKKESEKALKLYDELNNLVYFHNKNLTNKQYYLLLDIRDYLREISTKAYKNTKGKEI